MTPPKRPRGRPRKNPPVGELPPAKKKSAASGSVASSRSAAAQTASASTAASAPRPRPASTTPRPAAAATTPSPTPATTGSRLSSAPPTSSTPGTSTTTKSSEATTDTSSGAGPAKKQKVAISSVHKHFHQSMSGTDSNGNKLWTSKCKYCPPGSIGEYNSKSSSHLKHHLQTHHKSIAKTVEEEDEKAREANSVRELAKDKQGRALDAYLNWIAFSGLPLSTSDNPYFVKFYKELNDQIKLPGRKGTTTLLVNVKFRAMYQKLTALLQRVRVVHCTTDMWSNFRLRSSFIGFTGHMYDPLTQTRVCVRLALRPFNSPHTSKNIVEEASKIFRELGIMHKVTFCSILFIIKFIFPSFRSSTLVQTMQPT